MNKQTCELLSILLYAANNRFSYGELAAQMGVSTRMIRNYFVMIDQFLAQAGFEPLSVFPTGEICFCGTRQQASAIRQAMFTVGFYSYKLSAEERVQCIILLLLGQSHCVTLTELAALLYVSKGTLLKDLEAVDEELSRVGLALSPSKAKGFRLDIAEEKRRDLLLQRVESLRDNSLPLMQMEHIYDHFIVEAFHIETLLPHVEAAVKQAEAHFGSSWQDRSYHSLVLSMCLILHRIMEDSLIGELSFDTHEFQGSPCLDVACYLFSLLIDQLPIQVTDEEQFYLAKCLARCGIGDEQATDSEEQLQLSILTKSFLYEVSQAVGIDIVHDPMLQSFLANHIRGMLRREQRGEKDTQPFKEELKAQYLPYYKAIEANISIFQNELGLQYDDDQLTFILLHVIAAIERYYRSQGSPRVILVCNSGIGTANFLAERLKRYFRLQVVTTVSAHRLVDVLDTVPHDLIISTVPLKIDAKEYIQVSPILTEYDMFMVQRALQEAHAAGSGNVGRFEEGQAPTGCARLLPLSHLAIDRPADDWQDAIRVAGGVLLEQHLITPRYIDDMIRAVVDNGPYIVYVPGVALAHAVAQPGFSGFCASLVRLRSPVCFGHEQNDPVRYILTIQISDAEKYVTPLISLMDMMCDKTVRAALDSATTVKELRAAIVHYDKRSIE